MRHKMIYSVLLYFCIVMGRQISLEQFITLVLYFSFLCLIWHRELDGLDKSPLFLPGMFLNAIYHVAVPRRNRIRIFTIWLQIPATAFYLLMVVQQHNYTKFLLLKFVEMGLRLYSPICCSVFHQVSQTVNHVPTKSLVGVSSNLSGDLPQSLTNASSQPH